MLASQWPSWTLGVAVALCWLGQHLLRPHVRTWALATLPATILHELAHALLGYITGARPSSFNLWPRRVSATSWRLGYVGFLNLRWWNGGAVALAPLAWLLVILAMARALGYALTRDIRVVPATLPLGTIIALAVSAVWLWIAVAPGRTDWSLALRCWPSAVVFLAGWAGLAYWLLSRA